MVVTLSNLPRVYFSQCAAQFPSAATAAINSRGNTFPTGTRVRDVFADCEAAVGLSHATPTAIRDTACLVTQRIESTAGSCAWFSCNHPLVTATLLGCRRPKVANQPPLRCSTPAIPAGRPLAVNIFDACYRMQYCACVARRLVPTERVPGTAASSVRSRLSSRPRTTSGRRRFASSS